MNLTYQNLHLVFKPEFDPKVMFSYTLKPKLLIWWKGDDDDYYSSFNLAQTSLNVIESRESESVCVSCNRKRKEKRKEMNEWKNEWMKRNKGDRVGSWVTPMGRPATLTSHFTHHLESFLIIHRKLTRQVFPSQITKLVKRVKIADVTVLFHYQ